MLDTSPRLVKRQPPLVTEVRKDEYSTTFVLRHRKNAYKMQPEQRATILQAGAEQLETWASQMRNEAEMLVNGGAA
jgi:hypothetical protein